MLPRLPLSAGEGRGHGRGGRRGAPLSIARVGVAAYQVSRTRSPDVALAAHSRPHPSEPFINVRVQTTGTVPAASALSKACHNIERVCEHMEATLEAAVASFRARPPAPATTGGVRADAEAMDTAD